MSYPVSGLGKPQNGGQFPIVEDVDQLGGFQVRTNTTDRDSIPVLNQKVGMWVRTPGSGVVYELTAIGGTPTWATIQIGFTAGGDLSGNNTSQTVQKINGVALSGTPATGYVLTATGTAAATWQAPAAGFAAGGDLGGTPTSQTVQKINGIAVSGTPATGYVLTATGTTAATWQTAPSGFTAGGDLGGTPTSQIVQRINGVTINGTPAVGYSLVGTSGTTASWTAPPTGTGVMHYVGGVPASSAAAVDLTADVSGVLPALQGGGQVLWPTQSTATGTPVLLAYTPAVTTGAAVSVFGHILFDDNGTSVYDQVAQGLWRNNAGTLTGVYTPTPPAGNGSLLGCAISFVMNNTLKRIEMYGTLSGTAIGTTIYMIPELTYTSR